MFDETIQTVLFNVKGENNDVFLADDGEQYKYISDLRESSHRSINYVDKMCVAYMHLICTNF